MLIVAQKGLVYGPDAEVENSPELLENTMSSDILCHCDIWWYKEKWWLGEYRPQYQISEKWLETYRSFLFLHIRNYQGISKICEYNEKYTWFSLFNNKICTASNGHLIATDFLGVKNLIILSPEKSINLNTIQNLKENFKTENHDKELKGFITKYVNLIKEKYEF